MAVHRGPGIQYPTSGKLISDQITCQQTTVESARMIETTAVTQHSGVSTPTTVVVSYYWSVHHYYGHGSRHEPVSRTPEE